MKYVIDMIGAQRFSDIAEIQNLSYPQTVQQNVPFTFSYHAMNLTNNPLDMFGYITIGDAIVPGSEWNQIVQGNTYFPFSMMMSLQDSVSGTVVIGHYVDDDDCSQYTNRAECEFYGCYWWTDNTCRAIPEQIDCSQYTNRAECEFNNCYWYDNSCHNIPDDEESQEMNLLIPLAILGLGIATIVIISASKKPTRT